MRRLPFLRAIAMSTCSGITISYQLGEMHEASQKSVLLRLGLRLGIIIIGDVAGHA